MSPLRFLVVTAALLGCSPSPREGGAAGAPRKATAATSATRASAAPAESPAALAPAAESGNAEHGKVLAAKFECNRCHDGTGHPAMATEKHCTHCHDDIQTGKFGAGTPKIAEWKRSVLPYRYTPSLDHAGSRLRKEWLVRFLENPEDLRPNLAATMPRLALTHADALDLTAHLARDARPETPATVSGNPERGRALLESKACGGCHLFTGAPPLGKTPDPLAGPEAQRKGVRLAPDLAHARDRFRADMLVDWLMDPASLKPDTAMPNHSLTRDEATDLAAYLLRAPLTATPRASTRGRLPLLTRPVTYAEVEKRVLSITCRHCHGDADVAGGDGGPGNTGGFGFAPRGLDLSTYRSVASGILREDGQRHSVFEKAKDGTPFLVSALLARQGEEAGAPVAGVRGMPLGLPSVSSEDIQVVDTWIAQGRPR